MTAPVPPATSGGVDPLAARIVRILAARGQTAATAESLTGGLVAAALTSVPGSSAVFVGGVIAYATPLKTALLGVPADLLAEHGPVHPDVATAMARGVRDRLGASYGLSTTGVAGPGAAEGIPAGTVYVAVAGAAAAAVVRLALPGGRARVRQAAVQEVLALLVREVPEDIS
jgi:nicotinamide-nucleotide amidase